MASSPESTLLGNLAKLSVVSVSPSAEKQDIYIVCTGRTGCGSSTFINRLIERSVNDTPIMHMGDGQSSCTTTVQWTILVPDPKSGFPEDLIERYNIHVADTPGFDFNRPEDGVELPDYEIIQTIVNSVREKGLRLPGGTPGRLGIIVLHDSRRVEPPLARELTENTHATLPGHVIFLSTRCSNPARPGTNGCLAGTGIEGRYDYEDEWKILRSLIEKIDKSHYTIRSFTPEADEIRDTTHGLWKRFLNWTHRLWQGMFRRQV